MKPNRIKNWTVFLFRVYGVPALLLIAVLPVNHRVACACFRTGAPLIHAPQAVAPCPASACTGLTPVTLPEPATTAAAPRVPILLDAVGAEAVLSPEHFGANRAHSPPSLPA